MRKIGLVGGMLVHVAPFRDLVIADLARDWTIRHVELAYGNLPGGGKALLFEHVIRRDGGERRRNQCPRNERIPCTIDLHTGSMTYKNEKGQSARASAVPAGPKG